AASSDDVSAADAAAAAAAAEAFKEQVVAPVEQPHAVRAAERAAAEQPSQVSGTESATQA
ncbi:hypothetical protein, partial [Corynebacterium lipophiloflavum]